MKKLSYIPVIIMLFALVACKPEAKKIGPYYAAGDGIIGSWELDKVTISDLSLPVPEDDDPSDFYKNFPTHWKFTFNADSTYTVDEKGPGPDIFDDMGKWSFTSYPFPTAVKFYTTTDTINVALDNMPRETDQYMGFTFKRNGCDEDYISYNYNFKRITK